MALTKSELSDSLLPLGYSRKDAKSTVDAIFEEIRKSLESGIPVKISGFGNFEVRDKSQRPGRNPKTGEEIPITARRVVTFRAGHKLKARVENNVKPEGQDAL